MDKKEGFRELGLTALQFAVTGVPLAGGPIASLLADARAIAESKRVDSLVEAIASGLKNNADAIRQVDNAKVSREDFAELWLAACTVAENTTKQKKIDAAANIIVTFMLRDAIDKPPPYTELDHFMRAVGSLSTGAIETLAKMKGRRGPLRSLSGEHLGPKIRYGPTGTDPLQRSLQAELAAWNLAKLELFIEVEEARLERSPRVTQHDAYFITGMGERFISYVLDGHKEGGGGRGVGLDAG